MIKMFKEGCLLNSGYSERNIDALLKEEMTSNHLFLNWLLCKVMDDENYQLVSIMDGVNKGSIRECGFALLLKNEKGRHLVQVVNHMSSDFGASISDRITERAEEYFEMDLCDFSHKILIAPQKYLEAIYVFDAVVHYEDISSWLLTYGKGNTAYQAKAKVFTDTINYFEENIIKDPERIKAKFWMDFHTHAEVEHESIGIDYPDLAIEEYGDKIEFYPNNVGLTDDILLFHHLAGKSYIQFIGKANSNKAWEKFQLDYEELITDDMFFEKQGRSALICIATPTLDPLKTFEEQTEKAEKCLTAVKELIKWSETHLYIPPPERHTDDFSFLMGFMYNR